ncbi:BTAD domain-containing putative transcriptional regulator [Actinomadura keratinilytica]
MPHGALDLTVAQELAAEAEKAAGSGDLCQARALLNKALGLWDGEALAGVPGPHGRTQRTRLEEWRLSLQENLLEMDLEQGCHTEAVSELTALTAAHPLREHLRELLMLALYRSGRQAEALAVYADTRRLLAEELGVDPRAGLRELQSRILAADPALAEPETAAEQPASAPVRPAQLPATVPDFTGRAAFVAELGDALGSVGGRVMAVSAVAGIGGVGKTTLAVHVAHAARAAFPDGQLYVDLQGTDGSAAEPETVLGSFLRALGTPESAVPAGLDERAALYRSTLDGRRVLVLLDNARDAAQIRPLLPGAGGCAALITSRVRMVDLAGAHLVDLDVMSPEEALQLFTRIVGAERVGAEREAALDVVAACGFLPSPSASPPPGSPRGAPGRSRCWPPSSPTSAAASTNSRPATSPSRPPSSWATASWSPPRPAPSGCSASPTGPTSRSPPPPPCSTWTPTPPRTSSNPSSTPASWSPPPRAATATTTWSASTPAPAPSATRAPSRQPPSPASSTSTWRPPPACTPWSAPATSSTPTWPPPRCRASPSPTARRPGTGCTGRRPACWPAYASTPGAPRCGAPSTCSSRRRTWPSRGRTPASTSRWPRWRWPPPRSRRTCSPRPGRAPRSPTPTG